MKHFSDPNHKSHIQKKKKIKMKTFSKNNSVKLTKQIQRFIVQSISISISTIYGTECNENIGSIILKIRYFITDN